MDLDAQHAAKLFESLKRGPQIAIGKEHGAAVVAASNDVMRQVGHSQPAATTHRDSPDSGSPGWPPQENAYLSVLDGA